MGPPRKATRRGVGEERDSSLSERYAPHEEQDDAACEPAGEYPYERPHMSPQANIRSATERSEALSAKCGAVLGRQPSEARLLACRCATGRIPAFGAKCGLQIS